MNVFEITSAQNPKIKNVVSLLEKSKARREQHLFIAEGVREITACLNNDYKIDSLFLNSNIYHSFQDFISLLSRELSVVCNGIPVFLCTPHVYAKIAYRESTEGAVAVVEQRSFSLQDVVLKGRTGKSPFVLVVESVEKPGNLGALLRTADACGVDAVLVCDPLTDLYNPNLIRAGLGSFFTVQVAACSNDEALRWLKEHDIKIFTAQLQDSKWYYDTDFRQGTAIVMGSEAKGLTPFWRNVADVHIKIPMLGEMDSLNVSFSAGVLLYEVVRQRLSEQLDCMLSLC